MLLLLLALTSPALACKCPVPSWEEAEADTDLAFLGRAQSDNGDFEVIRVFKGKRRSRVTVDLGPGSCAVAVPSGSVALLFTEGARGKKASIDACSAFWLPDARVEPPAETLEFFGSPGTPGASATFAKQVLGDVEAAASSRSRAGVTLASGEGAAALLVEHNGTHQVLWSASPKRTEGFLAAWNGSLRPGLSATRAALAQAWDSKLSGPPTAVRASTCRTAAERPKDTLTTIERESQIVYGSLAALASDSRCWTLSWTDGFRALEAIVDDNGMPVLVWVIPEG